VTSRDVDRSYVLGHTTRELDRLDAQGAIYRDATLRAFREAGIGAGMRILDLGCGSGDVSLLAATLVGPGGAVVGIERDAGTAAAAKARADGRGVTNVTFRLGEITDVGDDEPFDALVGRFILMHQPDPAATLAAAARGVRPGGPVAFVESHMAALLGGTHSLPPSPLYDRVVRWKCAAVRAVGADLEAGLRLRRTFLDAGLPEPMMRLEAPVGGGAMSPLYTYMAESMRSMLPVARRHGIAGFDGPALDRLADDLRDELVASGGVLLGWPVVAAWCRKPAAPGDRVSTGS
jgi:SAM-dependent methyltransferase